MLEMNSSRNWEQGMVHPSQGMGFGNEHNSGSIASPLLSLFESQLAKNPDAIVFKKGNFCMSFRELDSRSRKLWHFLSHNYDIRTDDHIALIWDKNEHLLPMLLGILRSEGILLPIHPDTSQENMILMMAEYKCRTILDGSFMNSLEWSEDSFGELPPLNSQQEGRIIFQLHNQQEFALTSTLSLNDLEMALATLKLHLPETTGEMLQLNRNNLAAGLIECLYPVFYGGCLVLPEYENPHLPETMFPLQSSTGPNCLLADQQHLAALESGKLKIPDHWKKTRIFVSGNIHENCKLESFYNHSPKALNEVDHNGTATIKKQTSLSGDETSYTFTSDKKKSSHQEHIGLETSLSVYQLSIWNALKKSSTPAVFLRNYRIQLKGELDLDQFIHSHELLLQNQEILRTLVQEHPGGIVKQKIDTSNNPLFRIEIINFSENRDFQFIKNSELDFFIGPRGWENQPLGRFKLVQTGHQNYELLVSLHHLISDEESCGILLKKWGELYQPSASSTENALIAKPFIELVISEKRALETGMLSRQKLFWADRLSGIVQPVNLLSDFEDPLIRTYEGKIVTSTMDRDFVDTLHHLGRYHGGNLHTSLLALTKVLLFLHTGQEDFIVGTDSPGRLDPSNHNRVGPYNRALPIRSIFRQNDSWDSFHMELIRNLKDSYQHMDYPLSAGLEAGNSVADSNRMQLYNVYVTVREDLTQFDFGEKLEVALLEEEICTTKMDLHFNFLHGKNHLTLQLIYNKQLYPEIQMERLLQFFQRLVPQVKQKPGTAFHSLALLSKEEKNQQLEKFNNSQDVCTLDYTSLVQQFEQHAESSGDRPALHYRDKQLSYNELNKWSNKLSHYLINQHHVIPDEPVCVKLERSDWNIVALIALLKSGAGYLPIEYNSSADKTEYMIQDSGSKLLIEEEFMVEFLQKAESMEDYNPQQEIAPDQLACCLYPMYEKGLPKAVMLDHEALSLRMRTLWMELDFKENEKIMQAGLFGSEMFQTEFLLTLCNGGCLCLLDSEHLQNPQKTAAYILDKKIETIFFKPSFLTVFLNWLEADTSQKPELENLLKRIITCGHPVPTKMTRQWQGKINTRIYNLFGSAETSFVAAGSITDHQAIRSRIGKPLKFSRIVLLDRFNNLPPLGAAGEICIGGQCLARCYMNSPEKNRKHFIGNPHKPGEKLFRTGQLGRWNESGELEYLGMIEEELEMKGQKIDPDDIKAALLNCEGVHAAIVQLRENKDGKKEIIAFIGGLSDETTVMEEFKQRYPPQLCPDWIVKMNHLPVTSSRRIRY